MPYRLALGRQGGDDRTSAGQAMRQSWKRADMAQAKSHPEGETFDYVIVGAGSAGCVLASRLTEDADVRVCLLEAGEPDNSALVRMPSGVGELLRQKGKFNWGFETIPQAHLNNRVMWQPRGRGWGGSSSINGMIYIRGHASDYDQWAQMGLTGWSYRDVLPYFKRSEAYAGGADAWHGAQGPLCVSGPESGNPIYAAFIAAGQEAGYPCTPDFNGAEQEGVGPYQLTIKDGVRWSVAMAYLRPLLGLRRNLRVISRAHAHKVLLEGRRASGVKYSSGPGRPAQTVFARKEVLLAAGAMQSPQLLELSGIGDPALLAKAGIEPGIALASVGRNLQDHLDVTLVHECPEPITAHSMTKGLRKLGVGLNYVIRKQGPGRYNWLESGAFLRTRKELDAPDIQMHVVGGIMLDHGRNLVENDGFTVHICQLRPESRGEIHSVSADPFAAPAIDPNYFSSELDRRTLRDGLRVARDIVRQPAFTALRGPEIAPGAAVQTDNELDAWIRQTAETIYHPVGTCRMGADPDSVVDPQFRVRGVEGLRVIDASVMPTLIGGNTNAPTIMIAEKAADVLRGRPPLPPEDAPTSAPARAGV